MLTLKRYIITILFFLSTLASFAQMSLEEQKELINTVKEMYSISAIDGTNLYRTSKGCRVLVAVVTVRGYEDPLLRARGMATDFILGAENERISVYESHGTANSHKESLDQKIIESSKGRVREMQSLCGFKGQNGEDVYAYYLVVSKTNAKKGTAGLMSMVIPGMGQFYKGSTAKGVAFLGLTAAAGVGALACENTRSSYVDKINNLNKNISLYDSDRANAALREYHDKVNNFKTYRNICIGAAGAAYLWNVVDAFFAKSAQRPVVTNKKGNSMVLTPTFSADQMGVSLAYNF